MKYDIDTILEDYKKSTITLCDIFDVPPEMYRNIDVTKVGFSARVKTALRRGNPDYHTPTLYDLLTLTVSELSDIRLLGQSGIKEVFTVLQDYLFNTEPHIVRKTYGKGINIYRLGRSLKSIIEGIDIDYSEYRPTEIPYVEKYKEAVSLIDKELCMSAYKEDSAVYDIMTALYHFSLPVTQDLDNKARLEQAFMDIPATLRSKSLKMYLSSYCTRCKKNIEDFEIDRVDLSILEYHLSVINSSTLTFSKMRVISDFYKWLKFDISNIVQMLVVPLSDTRAETVVFKMYIGGLTTKQIAAKLEVTQKDIKKYIVRQISRFITQYRAIDYDLVLALYSLQNGNGYEITYTDFLNYIEHDDAHLIWNAIKHARSRFGNGYYEYDKENNRIIFDI